MRKLTLSFGLLLALLLVVGVAAAQEALTITLAEQSQSGQSGTATLTAMGEQTQVVLALNTGPAGAGVEQPAHIHSGTCENLGGVVYPLTNVLDGQSTTTVNVRLADLQTGDFAINVHKSAAEVAVYTACGNIPAASMLPTTGGGLSPVLVAAAAGAALLAGGLILRRRRA